MKLIINNFNIESNIYISRLNSAEEIDIYYKDLNLSNGIVTVDTYEFKNGIYRIEISDATCLAQPLEIELIYKWIMTKIIIQNKITIETTFAMVIMTIKFIYLI